MTGNTLLSPSEFGESLQAYDDLAGYYDVVDENDQNGNEKTRKEGGGELFRIQKGDIVKFVVFPEDVHTLDPDCKEEDELQIHRNCQILSELQQIKEEQETPEESYQRKLISKKTYGTLSVNSGYEGKHYHPDCKNGNENDKFQVES